MMHLSQAIPLLIPKCNLDRFPKIQLQIAYDTTRSTLKTCCHFLLENQSAYYSGTITSKRWHIFATLESYN